MKKTAILLVILFMVANVASAQGVNMGASTSLEVKANNGEAKASTSADMSTDVNSKPEGDRSGDSKSRSDASAKTESKAASDVSLKAREIRGWTESDKSDFLLTVKSHAELKSGQDLENFAKGVFARDESVESVVATEDSVKVGYKLPAKFLGMFQTELSAITNVTFDANGNAPEEVRVNFPWYRAFFSLDEEVQSDVLESAVEMNMENDLEVNSNANIHARNGRVIQLISSIFKNIRSSLDSEVEVDTSVETTS